MNKKSYPRSMTLLIMLLVSIATLAINEVRVQAQSDSQINALAWSHDGTRIATGSLDGSITIWDTTTQLSLSRFEPDGVWVNTLAWSPDDSQLAVVNNNEVTIWNTRSWQQAGVLPIETYGGEIDVVGITWDLTAERIITSYGTSPYADSWDARTFEELSEIIGLSSASTFIWSRDRSRVLQPSYPGQVRLSDGYTFESLSLFTTPSESDPMIRRENVTAAAWSPDERLIAGGGNRGSVFIWDGVSGEILLRLPAIEHFSYDMWKTAVIAVGFTTDNRIASLAVDGTFRIWNVASGEMLSDVHLPGDPIRAAKWSPDGSRLAYGMADGQVMIVETSASMTAPFAEPAQNSNNTQLGQFALRGLNVQAGRDQIIIDTDNSGTELVALDGTHSTSVDGTPLTYRWSENDAELATGPTPTLELAIGEHPILLTITDTSGNTASEQVAISVAATRVDNLLGLYPLCRAEAPPRFIWEVRNSRSNSYPVAFTWEVLETGQSGTGVVPPGGVEFKPAYVTISTDTTTGPSTMRLMVGGQEQATVVHSAEPCE